MTVFEEMLLAAADAIDAARYAHPDHPRERPRPFNEADRGDREYAFRLARAALRAADAPTLRRLFATGADAMSDLMKRRLELGEVTDGAGRPSHCDAIIYFANMYDSPEITINAPDAPVIAARIVDLWNAALSVSSQERNHPPSNAGE